MGFPARFGGAAGPKAKALGEFVIVKFAKVATASGDEAMATALSGGATIGGKAAGAAVDFAQGVAESHVENQGDQPQQQSTGCGDQCNQDEPK